MTAHPPPAIFCLTARGFALAKRIQTVIGGAIHGARHRTDAPIGAVAEVGPGGHFFGCAHTQARYQTAFHHPFLSDWRNFETWFEDGGKDATQRANALWKQALADYAPPECLPQERLEALSDFVARRTEEGGAPTDF